MKKIKMVMVALVTIFLVFPVLAQEAEGGEGVQERQEVSSDQKGLLIPYSGNFTLDIKVAPGFAQTLYGASEEAGLFGILFDTGRATGFGLDVGAMFSWKFLAVDVDYNLATMGKITQPDIEITSNGNTTTIPGGEIPGSGSFGSLEAKAGFIYGTKPGRADYYLVYGGFKTWNVSYTPEGGSEAKWSGNGWVAGVEGAYTVAGGDALSIFGTTSLFAQSLPIKKAGEEKIEGYSGIGFGGSQGGGVLFGGLGLSVALNIRADLIYSQSEEGTVAILTGPALHYLLTVNQRLSF